MDAYLFNLLQFDGGPFFDNLFWIVSGKLTWIPLYLVLLWIAYRKFGLKTTAWLLLFVIIGIAFCDQTCNFFKDGFQKLRPSHNPDLTPHIVRDYRGGLYGTVSAHSAISFFIATLFSLIISKRYVTILLILWAALVAYSRIYLGVHYLSDVVLGSALGGFAGWSIWRSFNYFTKR